MPLPITLNVKNRNVLVVGAGRVAARKVELLISEGAKVKVVSLEVHEKFNCFYEITLIQRAFEPQDVKEAFLVVAATHDKKVNQTVKEECQKQGVLFSCVQSEVESDFVLAASLKRGNLMVAVSTNGEAPGLSKSMRNYLDEFLSHDWELFLKEISEKRQKIKELVDPERRRQIIFKLSDREIVSCLQNEGIERTRELIHERVSEYV